MVNGTGNGIGIGPPFKGILTDMFVCHTELEGILSRKTRNLTRRIYIKYIEENQLARSNDTHPKKNRH